MISYRIAQLIVLRDLLARVMLLLALLKAKCYYDLYVLKPNTTDITAHSTYMPRL